MIRIYLIAMLVWLTASAGAAIHGEYEKHAAQIWCAPGEVLVYIWNEDMHGRPVKRSMRRCQPQRAPDAIYFDDQHGEVKKAR